MPFAMDATPSGSATGLSHVARATELENRAQGMVARIKRNAETIAALSKESGQMEVTLVSLRHEMDALTVQRDSGQRVDYNAEFDWDDNVSKYAKDVFGISTFRPLQLE
jgi:hypothetical protein